MELQLSIDTKTCTRCGKCVRVCPSLIFAQAKAGDTVEIINKESCIVCGHCVAACPTNSVAHSDFPADKVHPIDYTRLPTPEQMMLLCEARRSNRAFSSKPIPDATLRQILEAAHRAPTASNMQQVEFTLITDPEKLRSIAEFTIGVFDSILKKLQNPILKPLLKSLLPGVYSYVPTFERLKREQAAGKDLILRKATAVILIHTPKSSRFGCEDANLAYQNASLMAESFGVSQFYLGFVLSAIKQKQGKLEKALGIDGKIQAGMGLGMPSFRYPNYIDRKEIVVNTIE